MGKMNSFLQILTKFILKQAIINISVTDVFWKNPQFERSSVYQSFHDINWRFKGNIACCSFILLQLFLCNPLLQVSIQIPENYLNCIHMEVMFLILILFNLIKLGHFSVTFSKEPIFLLLAPHTFSVIIHENLTNVCTHDIAMHFIL